MKATKISQQKFQVYVGHTRHYSVKFLASEIMWFSKENDRVLFTILLCHFDWDFTVIVLARNPLQRYVCVDISQAFRSFDEAKEFIDNYSKTQFKYESEPIKKNCITSKDLFEDIKNTEKLHKGFKSLNYLIGYSAAKRIISEIINHYYDIDGNFIEQFQTSGFSARLFELYLFEALTELNFDINRDYEYPDYLIKKRDTELAIEAVTVNPSDKLIFEGDDLIKLSRDFMPIKWGSSLYSKLSKKYWEKEHVKGKPLVLAIADFHDDFSMTWSGTALIYYLYGIEYVHSKDDEGNLKITPQKITHHSYKNKTIESGFFFSKDSENISAVLFSATATLSKFNRMGILSGFGHPDVHLVRKGTSHSHDSNATMPNFFIFSVVEGKYDETWTEGLNLYHNPNALYPIEETIFPDIAQHWMRPDGLIESKLPDFSPFSSLDYIYSLSKSNK